MVRTHSRAQIPIVLGAPRQKTGQLCQRHLIDVALELDHQFKRHPVFVPAPGVELARGLANYSSSEARLIARKPSSEIEKLLGFTGEPELIHRDNLVLS